MDNQNISYTIPISDLAITTNIEDLSCIICLGICFKPIVITCCERLICSICIIEMLKFSKKCPYCNNINIEFEKPSKLIYRMFDNLSFRCPNYEKGCIEKIKYFFYFDHAHNICSYKSGNLLFCKQCEIISLPEHCCKQNDSLLSAVEKKIVNISKFNSNSQFDNINNLLHNHPLILTNLRKHADYEYGWCCELCNDDIRNPLTKSYHCEPCLFDICEKCFLFINSRVPNKNIHNHVLNLEQRELEWECNNCENPFFRRRSWYCNLCDYDICVNCYWK